MKKQILEHIEYLESEIDSLLSARDMTCTSIEKQIESLIAFNNQRLNDFKHERLVHLFVMLFFGFLCIVSIICFFISVNSPILLTNSVISGIALLVLTLVLFIIEAFYIKHYYFLENTIQKMYKYEKQLYEIQKNNL